MANLPETPTYDSGIYQLEVTDPVAGGPSGIANAQAKALANRTAYLKAQVDALVAGTTIPTTVAPVNSPAFTGDPKAPTAAAGDDDTSIATTAFAQFSQGGSANVNVGGNANITLTASQWGAAIVLLTGALTGNINVIFPTRSDRWLVVNATTGSFTVTCKTAAGTGVLITQGYGRDVYCDGANIKFVDTDFGTLTLPGGGSYLAHGDPTLVSGKVTVSTSAAPGSGTFAEGEIWIQTA